MSSLLHSQFNKRGETMNRITEFIDSFIPNNIPEKRKKMLRDELLCHLLDKADYYKELGWEENMSYDKAIEDFGTDTDIKNYILGEFEELYQEKTVWGIIAGLFIWAMNWMCFPLDIWVASADYNRDPDPAGTFVSFCMIFAVLGLIVFARIKKFRKMLFCIGVSNIFVVGIFLWCFYPQMASFSMLYNIIYLVDNFTPLLLGDSGIADGIIYVIAFISIPIALAVYPIVASILLKTGKIGTVKNPRKKCIITGCICVAICLITCLLQRTGWSYYEDYPVWFNPYNLTVAEETDGLYNKINIGDSKESTVLLLENEGFISINAYRSHLDRLTRKQFDADMEQFTFLDGYTVFFHPEKHIKGEGFVGIKEENGIVTGVAVGNLGKYMYDQKNKTFGYSNSYTWQQWTDIDETEEYFDLLQIGDKEEDIMYVLGSFIGEVYAKRKYTQNGNEITYYRVYVYGLENPDAPDYDQNDSRKIELTFTNGILSQGAMYDDEYIDKETVITKTDVK